MRLCEDEIIADGGISFEYAMDCIQREDEKDIQEIITTAGRIAQRIRRDRYELCSIVNAKSGLCSEDCGFCAQSMRFPSPIKRYPLLSPEKIVQKAKAAAERGVKEFCIVTSGRYLTAKEFQRLAEIVEVVRREVAIHVDVSIGFLDYAQACQLKTAGVRRVNHNVQTSAKFYGQIVSTHSYEDRIKTLQTVKEAGLEICCGVILGVGERREDRVQAAFEIKQFEPECVPINLLDPRPGTPLVGQALMEPLEILKTIAIFRLILPKTCLKLAGGRQVQLGEYQRLALQSGINGLIVGEYLTTKGNPLPKICKI